MFLRAKSVSAMVAFVCALAVPCALRADPLIIAAGHDLFVTQAGTNVMVLLPQDFFGPGSDPFQGQVNLTGNPTGPMGFPLSPFVPEPFNEASVAASHFVSPAFTPAHLNMVDTIVQRHSSAVLPGIGDTMTIPIEIVSLSLVSVQPIMVTFNNGSSQSFFDVFVTLDPNCTQTQGTMTLTRTSPNGGTFDSSLPVCVQLTFLNPTQTVVLGGVHDTLVSTDSTFTVVPEPTTATLVALGAAGLALLRSRKRTP